MDGDMSYEFQEFHRKIISFIAEKLDPISFEVENNDKVPDEITKQMAQIGLFGISAPKEYGGKGFGVLESCIITEELGKTNQCFLRHLGLGPISRLAEGADDQKERYLVPMIKGELMCASALSEPSAGSDFASITTTGTRDGRSYILNGKKTMILRGDIADIFIVYTVTDPRKRARGGITGFIVEREFPGFIQGNIQEKMGYRGVKMCEIVLDDCQVPISNILGEVGQGFKLAMKGLDAARLKIVGAPAVGLAQRCLEDSICHAKWREQFGGPLIEKQAIQFMLAEMAVDIHAARTMVYDAARKADKGLRISRESSIVKLFASEMACRVADGALQIHGGTGYMKDRFVEIAYRDARAGRIMDGTSEIQKIVISRSLFKEGK